METMDSEDASDRRHGRDFGELGEKISTVSGCLAADRTPGEPQLECLCNHKIIFVRDSNPIQIQSCN